MKNAQTSSYYILWTCALCISEDRILPLLENAKGTRLEAVLYHNMVVAITWLEIRQRSSQREQEKMASHIKALANLICTYFNNNHRYGLNLFYEVTKVYVCRMFCQVFFLALTAWIITAESYLEFLMSCFYLSGWRLSSTNPSLSGSHWTWEPGLTIILEWPTKVWAPCGAFQSPSNL